jgi:hypothetical protein
MLEGYKNNAIVSAFVIIDSTMKNVCVIRGFTPLFCESRSGVVGNLLSFSEGAALNLASETCNFTVDVVVCFNL